MKYVNRFNPENESCIPLTVDRITSFFFNRYYERDIVEKISNIEQIINFLKSIGLCVYGFYHPVFLFNPRYWRLFCKESFRPVFFLKEEESLKKKAYLYFTSGYELYKIKEVWNHVVAELFENNRRIYYDSYINIIQGEYPNLNIYSPDHKMLISSIASIILYIWRP